MRNKGKIMTKNKLWGSIKFTNICIMRLPDREERKSLKEHLKKILAKKSPNLMKNNNLHIQDTQQTPSSINLE